jgi:hypothetical protein
MLVFDQVNSTCCTKYAVLKPYTYLGVNCSKVCLRSFPGIKQQLKTSFPKQVYFSCFEKNANESLNFKGNALEPQAV